MSHPRISFMYVRLSREECALYVSVSDDEEPI
jgi:hypothetical protein